MSTDEVFRAAQKTLTFPSGATIFRAGDPGNEMFGIIEGSVRLTHGLSVVRELAAGDVFGEMALISSSARTANAIATSDTTLAAIDRESFIHLVEHTPAFALDVMRIVVERLQP